jgi:hypothetical protein
MCTGNSGWCNGAPPRPPGTPPPEGNSLGSVDSLAEIALRSGRGKISNLVHHQGYIIPRSMDRFWSQAVVSSLQDSCESLKFNTLVSYMYPELITRLSLHGFGLASTNDDLAVLDSLMPVVGMPAKIKELD